MAPVVIILMIVCRGVATLINGNCTTTNRPGYLCTCSGSGFNCTDVDECASTVTNKCDRMTSKCINTYGDYECQCFRGYVKDAINDTCVKPVVHLGLVDPELFSCCSSRSNMGGLVIKVIKTPSGQLLDMNKVGCIHPTSKKPTRVDQGYSRALKVTSENIHNVVMAFAKSIQRRHSAASVDVLSHFKYGGCYRTVSFFTGDKSIATTKPMYYEVEKLTTYKSLPDGNCIVFRNDQHYLTSHLITGIGGELTACASSRNVAVTTTATRGSLVYISIFLAFVLYQ